MKKFAVFLVFIAVSVAHTNSYAVTHYYNISANTFSTLPLCDSETRGKCILLPETSVTFEKNSIDTNGNYQNKTVTNTSTFGDISPSQSLCGAGTYLASCGNGNSKITLDLDLVTEYYANATDEEKMEKLRKVWSDNDLKHIISERCIKGNNIVCKACPGAGKITKASTCGMVSGTAEIRDFRTTTKTTNGITYETVTEARPTTYEVYKCNEDSYAVINTFWNCDMGSGTDSTGTYVYKNKNTQTDTNCYPATTALPD